MNMKNITVLIDNDSWILPYGERLVQLFSEKGYCASLVRRAEDVNVGWINFMLGCTRIVGEQVLQRNIHNLVVHESDLPSGRGFAPMAWQILEGKRSIAVCLIEAANEVDSGDIWLKDQINLSGDELCDDWRKLQGEKTIEICSKFVDNYESLAPIKQQGVPSYYARRRPEHSRLDPNKSLTEQMNLLRTVDNQRYPAYFEIDGIKYIISIEKINILF